MNTLFWVGTPSDPVWQGWSLRQGPGWARCSIHSLGRQSFLLTRPPVACSPPDWYWLAPLLHRKLPLLRNARPPQAEHLLMWSALARLNSQQCGWFGQVLPWLGLAFNFPVIIASNCLVSLGLRDGWGLVVSIDCTCCFNRTRHWELFAGLVDPWIQDYDSKFLQYFSPRCAPPRTGAICLGQYLHSNANLSVLRHGCSKPTSVLWSAWGLGSCFLSTRDSCRCLRCLSKDLQHYTWSITEVLRWLWARIASTHCLLDSTGTATSAWYVPARRLQRLQFGSLHRVGKSSAPQGESFRTSTAERTNVCLLVLLPAVCCRWMWHNI